MGELYWCHCLSDFSFQLGNICWQLRHEHGLFIREWRGSEKRPIHVVARLYEIEGVHRLSVHVSATRSP